MTLTPSAHIDQFARNNLPQEAMQPEYILNGYEYPEILNVGFELTDKMVLQGYLVTTLSLKINQRLTILVQQLLFQQQ